MANTVSKVDQTTRELLKALYDERDAIEQKIAGLERLLGVRKGPGRPKGSVAKPREEAPETEVETYEEEGEEMEEVAPVVKRRPGRPRKTPAGV